MIGINSLNDDMDSDAGGICGTILFLAWNNGRRFKIEVICEPELDPNGSFLMTVLYQPWPRTDRGRRRQDLPFEFDKNEQTIHTFETRSYRELLPELERWIARCTVWMREGN
ncbi:MAG: hypothetical protein Q8M32_00745 [Brevundimonas sp.]|nr:hypothetical protein [Brevundimonas sp.]MDZ4055263.1 hypothetical protein [Phenylobacterium sp.]